MAMLNVFDGNAFTSATLSAAIAKAPYAPSFLGSIGLFDTRPSRTTTIKIEEKHGTLQLINTAARGSIKDVRSSERRKVTPIEAPHMPLFQTIHADDVQNIRAFGSETELMQVQAYINEQLAGMRQDHEVTHEYHRIGAIKGIVLDGDGSTELYNLFTIFGITPPSTVFFDLAGTKDVAATTASVIRQVSDALGMTQYTSLLAVCGDTFFDLLKNNDFVKAGYERWQSSAFMRATALGPEYNASMQGFDFADVTWVNYRGAVGGTKFIADDKCHFVPRGVSDLFIAAPAPADMQAFVNTPGQMVYASQERLAHDKGTELHTQSNALHICTRPGCLITGDEAAS